ncbi:MAG: hypothetical protein AB8B50_06185 [Pirellulaceae bacterium]
MSKLNMPETPSLDPSSYSSGQIPAELDTRKHRGRTVMFGATCGLLCCLAMGAGFWMGTNQSGEPAVSAEIQPPPILAAAASASDTMAVATGPISSDAEGIFFLDFLTGDLQCIVYYPRNGTFGARFVANVAPQLGAGGKNAQYIMVTGNARTNATAGGARPGASLVYVTDSSRGMFAAYAVPWDRTAEASGRVQSGRMIYVGGGPIRNFQLQPAQQKPAGIVDPNQNP